MAKHKKGDIVWYQGDAGTQKQPAVITAVTSDDPAQYHVAVLEVKENTVCGEGEKDTAGAVTAL